MKANKYSWKPLTAGAALLLSACAAVFPSSDTEEGTAEGGSPLYDIVVSDAVKRLAETGRERARAQAPQPCPHCGQIHGAPRQAAEEADGAIGHGILAEGSSPPGVHHSAPDAATRAEHTPRYVYCANCRVYHVQPSSHDADQDAASPRD